jgi:hypothetical protein
MKTGISFALMVLTCLLVMSGTASAHRPTTVSLNYDLPKQSLMVWVGYYTEDRCYNYVRSVAIKVNGKTCQTHEYTCQLNSHGTVTRYYNVEAKPGDIIEVTATSTTKESKTESLTVKDKP